MKYLIGCFLVFSIALSSCSKKEESETTNKKIEDLEAAIFDYGYDQFKVLSESEQDNVVISPLSIASALYMTSYGADQNTKEQMLTTLHIEDIDPDHGILYKEFSGKIEDSNGDTRLEMANKVFFDENKLQLDAEFNEQCEKFEASPSSIDFKKEASVDIINSWVSGITNDRIPKVIDQISSDEVMFLINALYFIGDWENEFPDFATNDRPFTKKDGSTIEVPTMFNDAVYKQTINSDYSAVTLPFKGEKYEMTFILPIQDSADDFIQGHNHDSFRALLTEIKQESINERILLQMPKIELKVKYDLVSSLKKLGMVEAFNRSSADFSNFGSASGNMFLTRVLHDIYIKIDEKGVEGAAATTIGVGVTSVPPSVILDRPYVFVLSHLGSSVPVFIGEIRDPSKM